MGIQIKLSPKPIDKSIGHSHCAHRSFSHNESVSHSFVVDQVPI